MSEWVVLCLVWGRTVGLPTRDRIPINICCLAFSILQFVFLTIEVISVSYGDGKEGFWRHTNLIQFHEFDSFYDILLVCIWSEAITDQLLLKRKAYYTFCLICSCYAAFEHPYSVFPSFFVSWSLEELSMVLLPLIWNWYYRISDLGYLLCFSSINLLSHNKFFNYLARGHLILLRCCFLSNCLIFFFNFEGVTGKILSLRSITSMLKDNLSKSAICNHYLRHV